MILRYHLTVSPISLFLFLSCYISLISADESSTFNCQLNVDSTKFDLTTLSGEHTVSRTRVTPPSSMLDTVVFDLCDDLKPREGVAEQDQCPTGTRACLTKTNKKQDETDRITAVIPVAQTSSLDATTSILTSPKGLSLVFHGAKYPSDSDSPSQSFNVTLLCSEELSDPKFLSYDGLQVAVEWSAPAACGVQGDGDQGGDKDNSEEGNNDSKESVGSGIGWFFLALVLAFSAYFGLGAYYNYTTYGASGMDLIPHRDFWKEVPYMLSDVVSHLCSTVRPRRSSRGGYIAV